METICTVEVTTFTKEVEIINEVHAIGVTGRREPCVEAEQLHEAPHATTVSGDWIGQINIAVGLLDVVQTDMNKDPGSIGIRI